MGAFDPRTTVLSEVIVAVQILFCTADIGAWVGLAKRLTLLIVGD